MYYHNVCTCTLQRLDIHIGSPAKIVKCFEVSKCLMRVVNVLFLLQVDGDFAIDLFGELARAYLAAVNTRSQVMTPYSMKIELQCYVDVAIGLLRICYSRAPIII